MSYKDFQNPAAAQSWDADTRTRNPSRPGQLDMLLTIIADHYEAGKTILDLGMGSGLVEDLLFQRISQAQVVGVDASPAMLDLAHKRLQPFASQYAAFIHDFTDINSLQLPQRNYQIV